MQAVCNRFELFVINTRVYANMFAMLSYMFASAVAQAAQVVVARYMGGGDTEATDKCVRRTMYASVVISGLVSVLIYIFAEPLCGIFTSDARVIALAKTIMLIEIPLELGRAVNIVMCRALQACGDIRFPITICVISAWLTAFGGGMLLSGPLGLGLEGIWIAMACDECLRAGLFLWRWHTRTWSHIRLAAAYN
ncbi:MAG: MATE family efflux transporter [Oscillospiraceae bacterium]